MSTYDLILLWVCLTRSHDGSFFGLELHTRLSRHSIRFCPLSAGMTGNTTTPSFLSVLLSGCLITTEMEPGHITEEKEKGGTDEAQWQAPAKHERSLGFSLYCKENKCREEETDYWVKGLPFKHRYLCSIPSTHRKAKNDADSHGLVQHTKAY